MEQFFRHDFNLHKDSATYLPGIDCEMTDMVCFCHKTSCAFARYDERQNQQRMKFLRIISGCTEGARKWRIFKFCYAFA